MIGAARFLVDCLEANGVARAYCVPGESYLPVLDAFVDSRIELITCFHESAAGFMAVADGRVTGIPGICLVSRGPGATNAAIALHTAEQDAVPMILFVGQVPRRVLRRESFQEIDYGRMYGGICKWVAEVTDPARLPEVMARALHVATDATPGPVVVVLPEDVLEEDIDAPTPRRHAPVATAPDPAAVQAALDVLATARRPLIVVGGQIASDRGRAAVRKLAEGWSAPVAVSFRRLDLMSNTDPLYAGDLGISNTPAQMAAFRDADAIIAIGTRLGDLTTHGYNFPNAPWPAQKLVHVYGDARAIGTNYQPDVAAACDPVAFLEAMGQHRPPNALPDRRLWIERLVSHRRQIATWVPRTAPDGIVFGNVIQALHRRAPPDVIIATDAGLSAALVYKYFPFEPPQRLLATVTGCMGFGVPGAIAFAMQFPERRVVALLGDGGFLMTCNEIAIAVERRLPIIFLLANNRSLGSIRVHQERMYPGRKSATDLVPPDFQLFAQAHRCDAIAVTREDEIAGALDAAFAHTGGPILVEFRVSLTAILPGA